MKKYILTIALTVWFYLCMCVIVNAQDGTRPDQFANLKWWIKTDSLGKTYANGGQVDSIANWGSIGGWFVQATAGNRPLYRTNSSHTGLPGVDFDGTDDNMAMPSSTALFNFLHNGGDHTVFVVYMQDATGGFDTFFHNNAGAGANIGILMSITGLNVSQVLITAASAAAVINNLTTRAWNYAGRVQFITSRYDTDGSPDQTTRVNTINDPGVDNTEVPSGSNATFNMTLGFSTASTLNGKIYEIIAYSDLKTQAQVDSIEAYIQNKWVGSPTAIYRSIQSGNTSAIATNTIGTLTISSSTATFSAALPDTVGVGCVIQYDKDNNGTVDNLAFIHGRTSSTVFTVKDSLGGTSGLEAVTGDDAWNIFHAYTSIQNWEAGTENTGITLALRNFDGGNRATFLNNEQWFVALYRSTETTTVTSFIIDWATGPFALNNRVNLYTPRLTSEVGTSQFHGGSFTGGYRYIYSGSLTSNGIDVETENITMDGIVINTSDVTTPSSACITLNTGSTPTGITVKNSILKGKASGVGDNFGIFMTGTDTVRAKISNNWIYDCESSTGQGRGIVSNAAVCISYIYNNTIYSNSDFGIIQATGAVHIKNNLCDANGVDFNGTFATSINNASSDATATGSGSKTSQTFTYVDVANRNLRLVSTDVGAKESGVNLTSDLNLPVTTDMFGTVRPQNAAFEIGAFEVLATTAVRPWKGSWDGAGSSAWKRRP